MTVKSSQNRRLCAVCQGFDIQTLLLRAESSVAVVVERHVGLSLRKTIGHQEFPFFHQHQPNLTSLKLASKSCDLCAAIWTEYSRIRAPRHLTDTQLLQRLGTRQLYIGIMRWFEHERAVPIIAVYQRDAKGGAQLASFEVCVDTNELPLKHDHLLARLQASSSADELCFELARKWLDDCRKHHTACRSTYSSSSPMPTRLLDVGVAHGTRQSGQTSVCLVRGASCQGPYAALSYCWGPDRDLILTHESMDELCAGIDLARFPRTLRDAVIVTREIGMRYLWIDALCIFQDQERPESKADWAREAGRMRNVYRFAAVTIEAASATRGNEGFLKPRVNSKPYCALQWGDDPDVSVLLRPVVDITTNQLSGTKIYTRGWTSQERLLAPRTLSFGSQQCSFECPSAIEDEAGHSSQKHPVVNHYSFLPKHCMSQLRNSNTGWPNIVWRTIAQYFHLPAMVILFTLWGVHLIGWLVYDMLEYGNGQWMTHHDYWLAVVGSFSQSELSNSADRLPALSGLADEFQRVTGGVYVAGMWRDELVSWLAWTCDDIHNPDQYPDEYNITSLRTNFVTTRDKPWPDNIRQVTYVAPSWSWASVQGKIFFPAILGLYRGRTRFATPLWTCMCVKGIICRATVQHVARIDHVQVWPEYPSDPLGRLKGGVLILSSLYLAVPDLLKACPENHPLINFHEEIQRTHIKLTEGLASEFYQHHDGFSGQTFGVVQLLTQQRPHAREDLHMLLVESCGDGNYRRLCCVDVSMPTLNQRQKARPRQDNDKVGKRIDAVSREISDAPWEKRVVTLI